MLKRTSDDAEYQRQQREFPQPRSGRNGRRRRCTDNGEGNNANSDGLVPERVVLIGEVNRQCVGARWERANLLDNSPDSVIAEIVKSLPIAVFDNSNIAAVLSNFRISRPLDKNVASSPANIEEYGLSGPRSSGRYPGRIEERLRIVRSKRQDDGQSWSGAMSGHRQSRDAASMHYTCGVRRSI